MGQAAVCRLACFRSQWHPIVRCNVRGLVARQRPQPMCSDAATASATRIVTPLCTHLGLQAVVARQDAQRGRPALL